VGDRSVIWPVGLTPAPGLVWVGEHAASPGSPGAEVPPAGEDGE